MNMSSSSSAVVVVVVALLAMAATDALGSPPFPCTFVSPANDLHYDLSNMYRDPSRDVPDFTYAHSDRTFFYVYESRRVFPQATAIQISLVTDVTNERTANSNVCGQAAELQCNPPNGVCSIAPDGEGFGDGDASRASWSALRTYRLVTLLEPARYS